MDREVVEIILDEKPCFINVKFYKRSKVVRGELNDGASKLAPIEFDKNLLPRGQLGHRA